MSIPMLSRPRRMPLYEFWCLPEDGGCDARFEEFVRDSRTLDSHVPCHVCGKLAKRVPSAFHTGDRPTFRDRSPGAETRGDGEYWHHGVGAFVRTAGDIDRVAKQKGLEFVGREHGG